MSTGILIVGFGHRGRAWRNEVAGHRGCHVAGVADPDGGARAAAEADGIATWERPEDALVSTTARVAIVATPPGLHAAHAVACLGAGLGVLVEKPLALSLEDAAAVADAAEAADRPAVVGHNFRHRPLERTLRAALDGGGIGELRTASIVTARPATAAAYDLLDHGPLWDLGVHHIDLLRLRMGGPPSVVEARATPSADGLTYTVHMEWEGGATADYWLREGASVYHHAEWLEGPRGALRAIDGRVWLVTPSRRPRRLRAARGPSPERVLLDAVLGDDAPGMGAREALGTIATVEATARSIALERPVRVAELLGAVPAAGAGE